MENKDYNFLLYEKAAIEYSDFIERIKEMEPNEIVNHAYEKVIKEDILATLETKKMEQKESKALYLKKYPLDYIYQEWLSNDYGHMNMIEDTINESADKAVKERKENKRESR